MRVRVRCSYELEVEVYPTITAENIHFHIEENGCPGTREVGAALDALIEKHDAEGTCWACAANGENKIIEILA